MLRFPRTVFSTAMHATNNVDFNLSITNLESNHNYCVHARPTYMEDAYPTSAYPYSHFLEGVFSPADCKAPTATAPLFDSDVNSTDKLSDLTSGLRLDANGALKKPAFDAAGGGDPTESFNQLQSRFAG